MFCGERMFVHKGVHGGCSDSSAAGEVPAAGDTGGEVVAKAVGDFGEGVGAQRRKNEHVGALAELNVQDAVANALEGGPLVGI